MYDDDDNKTIGMDNLQKVADELGEDVPEHDLKMMLKIGDRSGKFGGEEVDFDDFMYIMKQAKLY